MNARKTDASHVVIFRPKKSNSKITKFKLRTKKYLYTLVVRDNERAKKIETSLPPSKYLLLLLPIFSRITFSHLAQNSFESDED